MLAMVEDECIALNSVLTLMVNHLQMFAGQVFYEEGAMSDADVERIKNGEQGSIHQVQAGALTNKRIDIRPPLPMGPEYFNVINILFNIIDRVLGIPDFQRMQTARRKTATEASFEQGDVSVRREYFREQVKEFILENVRKIGALMQERFDEDRWAYLEGEPGRYVKYSKDDIQGDFEFDFDMDSLKFVSEAQVQQLINALNIMASQPILQPMLSTLDPVKTAKQILKWMGLNIESIQRGDSEITKYYTPEAENDMALKMEAIPDPKPNEDQDEHLNSHTSSPMAHTAEGFRHIQRHIILVQAKKAQVSVTPPPPGGQPSPGQSGPLQAVPGSPVQAHTMTQTVNKTQPQGQPGMPK
jgi:hypothetical protein